MVTYENVFEAFCRYAASRSQSDWCELWIISTRRMEALVKTKLKNKAALPDFPDIITDATSEAMLKMQCANLATADAISKLFWIAYRNKTRDHFRELAKIRRIEAAVNLITEIYFEKDDDSCEELE